MAFVCSLFLSVFPRFSLQASTELNRGFVFVVVGLGGPGGVFGGPGGGFFSTGSSSGLPLLLPVLKPPPGPPKPPPGPPKSPPGPPKPPPGQLELGTIRNEDN